MISWYMVGGKIGYNEITSRKPFTKNMMMMLTSSRFKWILLEYLNKNNHVLLSTLSLR